MIVPSFRVATKTSLCRSLVCIFLYMYDKQKGNTVVLSGICAEGFKVD